jgi:hypothetical protein
MSVELLLAIIVLSGAVSNIFAPDDDGTDISYCVVCVEVDHHEGDEVHYNADEECSEETEEMCEVEE